jgi:hypothetical protein
VVLAHTWAAGKNERTMQMLESSGDTTERGHELKSKQAWDCGCGRHLEATCDEALIARIIYHLDVQHPEAHPTLEQAEEFVAAETYEEVRTVRAPG